jgi:hypothetical protein
VVQKIDKDTKQLTRALSSGVPIIITTIQKFPFVARAIDTMGKQGETVELDTTGIHRSYLAGVAMPESDSDPDHPDSLFPGRTGCCSSPSR